LIYEGGDKNRGERVTGRKKLIAASRPRAIGCKKREGQGLVTTVLQGGRKQMSKRTIDH